MADIKVVGKLMQTPRVTANIYRLKSPVVNERAVREIASRIGVKGDGLSEKVTSDADKITYSAGHLEVTMYRASGGIRFIDRSRWQVDDRKADLKMEDADATRRTQALVKKYKLAPAAETKFLKAARLRVGEATKEGKEASVRTIDVAVALQRLVDKVPVDGPGGKVIVYLDHEGQMTGFERIWRETARVHKRGGTLRSPQEAIADMAEHFKSKHSSIQIEEVRFGYFEEGWRSSQEYLQPAYVIVGMIASPDSRIRKRTIYVAPALSNAMGPITPPLQRKRPQTDRAAVR